MKIQIITTNFDETQLVENLESKSYSLLDATYYIVSEIPYYVSEFEGNENYNFERFHLNLQKDLDKLNIKYRLISYE